MAIDVIEDRAALEDSRYLASVPSLQLSTDEAAKDVRLLSLSRLKVGITSRNGVFPLVSDASLTIGAGEVTGLVGETGSGKSLVAKSIAGLLPRGLEVVSGSIVFDGVELTNATKAQLRAIHGVGIAYVPQNPFAALAPVTTLERQFRAAARAHTSWTKSEIRDRAMQRLSDVGLRDPARILQSYAHQLSGGMAQRVVIALSTIFSPRLVVADEPTTGLDPTVQKRVLETLVAACTEMGSSVILISHDLGIVSTFADNINVMYAGRTVEVGPASEVFATPLHPYTWGLLASLPREGKPGAVMRGSLPEPTERGCGCEFAVRCSNATDGCSVSSPAFIEVIEDRRVSCHLYREPASA
jgi:oligopeptide/dipeptide ABC transporter ATP-binding protein